MYVHIYIYIYIYISTHTDIDVAVVSKADVGFEALNPAVSALCFQSEPVSFLVVHVTRGDCDRHAATHKSVRTGWG